MRWLVLFCLLLPGPLLAHKASDGFLSLQQSGESQLAGQWDIALLDLERALGLDQNQDGQVTWAELRAQQASVFAFALPALSVATDQGCLLSPGEMLVNDRAGEPYASLAFSASCAGELDALKVTYNLFFDADPGHRGFFSVQTNGQIQSAVFSPANTSWSLTTGGGVFSTGFVDFVREGIWHIWIGYDHIAFLVLLLLPAVLRRKDGNWSAESNVRDVTFDVARIVTAFTLAHSVTLSLAALEIVRLPSNMVEMAIAVSVVIAGLHNVFPDRLGPRWVLAFGFGLIHGFGFANVLGELGNGNLLLLELFGFNLGVEIGQLAIALVIVPAIYLLRSTRAYRQAVVPVTSLIIAALAGFWFYQRAVI